MKSIRLMMTLFTLLGLGGMARADDRLWNLYKEVCLETKLNVEAYSAVLSKKWNMQPEIETDEDTSVRYFRFAKEMPFGDIVFNFKYVDSRKKERVLHCSLNAEIKNKKIYEDAYLAFYKEGRISTLPKDKVAMKNKENEKVLTTHKLDGEEYNFLAYKSRVKASDMNEMPPNTVFFMFHKIYVKN
jgi:hypothetical protein